MSVIYIDTSSLKGGSDNFKNMSAELAGVVDDVLNGNAEEMAAKAHQNIASMALSYKGDLQERTTYDNSKFLSKTITSGVIHAAFVEFGTGVYAAQYVSSLPQDWQEFASQFRQENGTRTIKGLLFLLTGWFAKKGITDKQHAFFIARKIFINGTKPHSFLYKAYVDQLPQLEEDLNNALKAFGK